MQPTTEVRFNSSVTYKSALKVRCNVWVEAGARSTDIIHGSVIISMQEGGHMLHAAINNFSEPSITKLLLALL